MLTQIEPTRYPVFMPDAYWLMAAQSNYLRDLAHDYDTYRHVVKMAANEMALTTPVFVVFVDVSDVEQMGAGGGVINLNSDPAPGLDPGHPDVLRRWMFSLPAARFIPYEGSLEAAEIVDAATNEVVISARVYGMPIAGAHAGGERLVAAIRQLVVQAAAPHIRICLEATFRPGETSNVKTYFDVDCTGPALEFSSPASMSVLSMVATLAWLNGGVLRLRRPEVTGSTEGWMIDSDELTELIDAEVGAFEPIEPGTELPF